MRTLHLDETNECTRLDKQQDALSQHKAIVAVLYSMIYLLESTIHNVMQSLSKIVHDLHSSATSFMSSVKIPDACLLTDTPSLGLADPQFSSL
jgi:hypothetical protein